MMTTHVKALGWLFILFGIFYVLMAFGASMLLGALAAFVAGQGGADAEVGATVLGLTGGAFFIFWLGIGLPGILAGWGLLTLRPWARILAIVLSAIRLVHVPLGTILGVYGLWVLFHKDTEALFTRTTPAA